ncbi:MAG: hypothetical protein Q8L46_01085, partial [candidate division WWE3 bacterium]|nr:hypothetical protein [candidate division WWE3 bacterium]
ISPSTNHRTKRPIRVAKKTRIDLSLLFIIPTVPVKKASTPTIPIESPGIASTRLLKKVSPPRWPDFITYTFNQFKPNVSEGLSEVFGKQSVVRLGSKLGFSPSSKPSELNFEDWVGLFNSFLNDLDYKHQGIVKGSYTKLVEQQEKLEKIHRTRVDKNWRRYPR